MKKLFILTSVVAIVFMAITFTVVGCKTTEVAEDSVVAEESTEVEDTVESGEKTILTVAAFECAYGDNFINETIRIFEENNPNVEVDLLFDPKIDEMLQPMFVAGNPPDVCNAGTFFDLWGAIIEGKVKPLDEYLNSSAIDKDMLWIDTFAEGTFTAATHEGKIWYLPLLSTGVGWWYNETVLSNGGWVPPENWDEAYVLFDEMKAEGIAPIANQGVWPIYLRFTYIPEFIARLAGPDKLEACFNLEEDSWTDPEVVKAFAQLEFLAANYFQEGNLGMNHTQSQAEVMVGNAGLIACGSWFPKEMSEVWQEGDIISCMAFPSFDDSPYPQNVHVLDHESAEIWFIPEEGKNEDLAVEFLKTLYSEEVQKFTVNDTGITTVYDNSSQWIPDNKFGNAVQSCMEFYEGADYTFSQRETFEMWYPSLTEVVDDNALMMISGKATPAEVCAAIQEACDEYRADAGNLIHSFSLGLD